MLKKSLVVGVSITPDVGLEVAQIDFASQMVLKYGVRKLEYDSAKKVVADLDLFKDALQDLFTELGIPPKSDVVLTVPVTAFKINDYPAAIEDNQVSNAIEEELMEHPLFKTDEPCVSAVQLPNSSIQFKKIAYAAVSKQMIIEMSMIIKSLGYKVYTIDNSINSVLNALMYNQRVNVQEDVNWVLMIVGSTRCQLISMNGKNYVDAYEEKISIGEVLGDAENYSTVVATVEPLLKNLPSKYLCVVSKTNIISAELLASKLTYPAPITYQEANCYSKEVYLECSPEVDSKIAQIMSLDVIGAAINRDFEKYSNAHFNFFNESLGAIYLAEQPLKITIAGHVIELTNNLLISLFIVVATILAVIIIGGYLTLTGMIKENDKQIEEMNVTIKQINEFLEANNKISAEMFDEGDEIRVGLDRNKNIYTYYTIVGTEIPKKLWLTSLKLGEKTTVEGQADNLESVYAFFRSIKDYEPDSAIKLQRLGLASKSSSLNNDEIEEINTDSILSTLNADFYEFAISDDPEVANANKKKKDGDKGGEKSENNNSNDVLPGLEPISDK